MAAQRSVRADHRVVRILRLVALLSFLTLLGTLGFYLLERDWSFLDALYMTVITLTTIGYKEVHELSPAGRIFLMVYLLLGIGVFLYSVIQLGELIVQTQLRDWLGRRMMDATIRNFEGHYVICGFGRMGAKVCRDLAARRARFIAIDQNEEALEQCEAAGWPWLVGDVTDDRTLLEAGIKRARGLAALTGDDADNLYVVLSARLLNPDIVILARTSDEKSAAKMKKAGANRVVSLYTTGAAKVTQLLVNPTLEDFVEIFTKGGRELDLAEVHVSAGTKYSGKRLADTDLSRRGVMVVGIQRPDGDLLLPPPSSEIIEDGDVLIVLGKAGPVRHILDEV